VVTSVVAAVLVSAPPIAAAAAPLATGSSLSASASPLEATATSTRAEIGALRHQITAEAGQIHGYVDQFDQASSQAVVLSQELAAQRSQLVGLRHGLDKAQKALRAAAIQSYTGSDASTGLTEVSGSANAAIGTEFLSVASSDISDLEDNYRAEQSQVTTAIVRLTAEQRANDRAITAAATARSQALTTATQDQGQLATLEDRLAKLGAAQGGPSNNGLVKSTRGSTSTTARPALQRVGRLGGRLDHDHDHRAEHRGHDQHHRAGHDHHDGRIRRGRRQCRRGLAGAAGVRVWRQLSGEHWQRLLRRLPVLRTDLVRHGLPRLPVPGAARHAGRCGPAAPGRSGLGPVAGLRGQTRPHLTLEGSPDSRSRYHWGGRRSTVTTAVPR
jgi:uncharacterized membrane protein